MQENSDSNDAVAKNLFKTDHLAKFQNFLGDSAEFVQELNSPDLIADINQPINRGAKWLGMRMVLAACMYQATVAGAYGLSESEISTLYVPIYFLKDCLGAKGYQISRVIRLLRNEGKVDIDVKSERNLSLRAVRNRNTGAPRELVSSIHLKTDKYDTYERLSGRPRNWVSIKLKDTIGESAQCLSSELGREYLLSPPTLDAIAAMVGSIVDLVTALSQRADLFYEVLMPWNFPEALKKYQPEIFDVLQKQPQMLLEFPFSLKEANLSPTTAETIKQELKNRKIVKKNLAKLLDRANS